MQGGHVVAARGGQEAAAQDGQEAAAQDGQVGAAQYDQVAAAQDGSVADVQDSLGQLQAPTSDGPLNTPPQPSRRSVRSRTVNLRLAGYG